MTSLLQDNALSAHIERLKNIPNTSDRRIYLEEMEHKEGKERADFVKQQFLKWWDYRERQRKV